LYKQCVKAERIAKLIKHIIVGEMAIDKGRSANTAVYIIMWEEIAPSSIINKYKKRGHLKLGITTRFEVTAK